MRYTHAIVVRIPNSVKLDDKKANVDFAVASKQLDDLSETLREAGVDVVELSPQDDCTQQSLYVDDAAVVINGTALITRPKKAGSRIHEITSVLEELSWQVIEAPANDHGKPVVLEGSDVLFTGKEIFVGTRKNGTNMEGAMVVGRTFSDLAVIPIALPGADPLKHYVSLVSTEVLAVGSSKEAKLVLQRIEREATFRYKTLTVEYDEAVSCFNVNDHIIYRQDTPDTRFQVLQEPLQVWGVTMSELVKLGNPATRFCLLVKKMKALKSLCDVTSVHRQLDNRSAGAPRQAIRIAFPKSPSHTSQQDKTRSEQDYNKEVYQSGW
uniref:Dimethylargininase n=1 Tax=Parascaris univalens TaxID=6257 RepID=A0A915AHJ3_PARUN